VWLGLIKEVVDIIIVVQHDDGGFDIGYDFDYGSKHKTGEPTTPEMLMLVSLKLAKNHLKNWDRYTDLLISISKAEKWIISFARKADIGWEIPYSPYSDSNVVVNNAVSFAIGALGIELKDEYKETYEGFKLYMASVLQNSENGSFWFYYTPQQQQKMPKDVALKVDYYHIAQQLEMHSYAEIANADDKAHHQLISSVESELVSKFLDKSQYKLIENVAVDSQRIHVWGLTSIIPGLITSYKLTANPKALQLAEQIGEFVVSKCFRKNYFVPVINSDGSAWDVSVYVRSDAWCIHALSSLLPHVSSEKKKFYLELINAVVTNIRSKDYSGIENHASSTGLEILKKVNFWIRRKI